MICKGGIGLGCLTAIPHVPQDKCCVRQMMYCLGQKMCDDIGKTIRRTNDVQVDQ